MAAITSEPELWKSLRTPGQGPASARITPRSRARRAKPTSSRMPAESTKSTRVRSIRTAGVSRSGTTSRICRIRPAVNASRPPAGRSTLHTVNPVHVAVNPGHRRRPSWIHLEPPWRLSSGVGARCGVFGKDATKLGQRPRVRDVGCFGPAPLGRGHPEAHVVQVGGRRGHG